MINAQAYEPLAKVELMFAEHRKQYRRQGYNRLSITVPSLLPLKQTVVYTIGIEEPARNFVLAKVKFGLILPEKELKNLTHYLDCRIRDVIFQEYVGAHMLCVSHWIDCEDVIEELLTFRRFCDFIYPLITHIRKEREWNEQLVELALFSNLVHA